MPPREANNLFPDQFLSLEYDAGVPPAIPHDPTPVNFDLGGQQQQQHQPPLQPQPQQQPQQQGLPVEGNGTNTMGLIQHDQQNLVGMTANNVDNDSNEGMSQPPHHLQGSYYSMDGQSTTTGALNSTNSVDSHGHSHHLNSNNMGMFQNQMQVQVDPLSIDPTEEDDNPMNIPTVSMEHIQFLSRQTYSSRRNYFPSSNVSTSSNTSSSSSHSSVTATLMSRGGGMAIEQLGANHPSIRPNLSWSPNHPSSIASDSSSTALPIFFTNPVLDNSTFQEENVSHHSSPTNISNRARVMNVSPAPRLIPVSVSPARSPSSSISSSIRFDRERSMHKDENNNTVNQSPPHNYRLYSRQVSLDPLSSNSSAGTANDDFMNGSIGHTVTHRLVSNVDSPQSTLSPSPRLKRNARRLMHSVLDKSTSIDEEDDSISCPPALDSTHHSHSTIHSSDELETGIATSFEGNNDPSYSFTHTIPLTAQSQQHSSNEMDTVISSHSANTELLSTGEIPPLSPDSTPDFSLKGGHPLLRNNAFDSAANTPQQTGQNHFNPSTDYTMSISPDSDGFKESHNLLQHDSIPSLPSPDSQHTQATPSIASSSSDSASVMSHNKQNSRLPQFPFSFGPNTTVADLKYFAERGYVVTLLAALHSSRLTTLGCRMLADYAKMPERRVAVASNKRILEFIVRTMHEFCEKGTDTVEWLGREYAVEAIRSLTATEESDAYLMRSEGILQTLALCARGGPFLKHTTPGSDQEIMVGLSSGRARLHACIAIMNLSCGKSNKVEIAKSPLILEAMRDAMLMRNPILLAQNSQTCIMESKRHAEEARLKATTCIKNLSNADANDEYLLNCPGLIQALGQVAATCSRGSQTGCDATTTTNACLAIMNLSISKANKHLVFRTPGVMDALMEVISLSENMEAKMKACSALSNLAIGYDNKIPMFSYPGFVESILNVIETDRGEARTKACSILWSFAAEMKNQVPVVQRGDILPILVRVAEEDTQTEARFKCVAALTLLAESLENAIPLLESGALSPLMEILHEAGPDPTQWKGQTASWCVGFLMNIAQSDEAVPSLREAGVVELLAPLLTLDHYQSLKAAMAVTFACRYDEGDETYDLLRKTETVIPKIISLLHNTLAGRGGNGYKYGVFTLRSSVGCIASLANGPEFMKERIATEPVYDSLLRVLMDFCFDKDGTKQSIVGGGRDDTKSASLAIRALYELTHHLIPISNNHGLPFGGSEMRDNLIKALASFACSSNQDIIAKDRQLAMDTRNILLGRNRDNVRFLRGEAPLVCCGLPVVGGAISSTDSSNSLNLQPSTDNKTKTSAVTSSTSFGRNRKSRVTTVIRQSSKNEGEMELIHEANSSQSMDSYYDELQHHQEEPHAHHNTAPVVRTFLLSDHRGRRFAVPINPSGERQFNDNRLWCYRRGRFCREGETPDPAYRWTRELQSAYMQSLAMHSNNGRRSYSYPNMETAHSF